MAFKDYLGAFLLGASAFLYPLQEAKAEDKEAKVVFQDKGTRGIPIIGKPDLEGIVNASAWTENNKINISIKTDNCYIGGNTRIFLGLQIDADLTQIKQTAIAQTKDGNKTIDVSSPKTLKNIEGLVGKGVIRIADVAFLSDIIDAVNYVQGKEDRNIERQMRKEHRLLLRELPLHTKFILNPITGINYEISIDREQTETPQVIAEVSLRDEYKREAKTDKIWLKCDKRATKQMLPKSKILTEIQQVCSRITGSKLEQFIESTNLSKELGRELKDAYFLRYFVPLQQDKECGLEFYIIAAKDKESVKEIIGKKVEPVLPIEVFCLEKKGYYTAFIRNIRFPTDVMSSLKSASDSDDAMDILGPYEEKFNNDPNFEKSIYEAETAIYSFGEDYTSFEKFMTGKVFRPGKEMNASRIMAVIIDYSCSQREYYNRAGKYANDLDKLYNDGNVTKEIGNLISKKFAEADDDSYVLPGSNLSYRRPYHNYLFHDINVNEGYGLFAYPADGEGTSFIIIYDNKEVKRYKKTGRVTPFDRIPENLEKDGWIKINF